MEAVELHFLPSKLSVCWHAGGQGFFGGHLQLKQYAWGRLGSISMVNVLPEVIWLTALAPTESISDTISQRTLTTSWRYMSLKYEDGADILFMKHRWRATKHIFKLAARRRYAVDMSPTSDHVLITDRSVILPAVNCQCPQVMLLSSSLISGA